MAGNPKGSAHRATPEAKRGTHMASWRLTQDMLDAVAEFAVELRDGKGLAATALLLVGLRHRDEARAEAERLKGAPSKSTDP